MLLVKRGVVLVLLAAAAGCGESTTQPGMDPTLDGLWAGEIDSDWGILLVLTEADDLSVHGSGVMSSASEADVVEVRSGIHLHPYVSIVLATSSHGDLVLVGRRSDRIEDPLSDVSMPGPGTITGQISGGGYVDQPLVLTKQGALPFEPL